MSTATAIPLSNETFLAERTEYEEFVKLVGAECWDEVGGEKRPNKKFFRQLARRFGVNVINLHEEAEYVPCNPDVCPKSCPGGHYEARFSVRATRRSNGAVMDGDGSCIDNEKWPSRSKHATAGQVKAINKELSKYADAEKLQLLQLASNHRCDSVRQLHPLEASAMLDYFYGKTTVLEPATAPRNTRHNVRGTARTRAVNRAISDLIADGVVSAEEMPRTEHEDFSQAPKAKGSAKEAPRPVPAAAKPVTINDLQVQRIKQLAIARGLATEESGLTDSRLKQYLSDLTAGAKCRVEHLDEKEAGSLIIALQKKQSA